MASALSFEDEITCNVCYRVCENPQCLKCLHVFCHTCVQKIKQGTEIKCPECRKTCSMSEVQKDFRTQKLIDQYKNVSKQIEHKDIEPFTPTICGVCKNQSKPAESCCKICHELLCIDCATAHQGSIMTKDHELIDFLLLCTEKEIDIKKEIRKLQHTKSDVIKDVSSTKDLMIRIEDTENLIIQEINHFRKAIQSSVDKHHDKLIDEVKAINNKLKKTLKQNETLFDQCEKKLHKKISSLSKVCGSQNYSLMMETLSNLSQQIENYIQEIQSELPQVCPDLLPKISVTRGVEFDPKKLTAIEVVPSSVDQKSELTSKEMDRNFFVISSEDKSHYFPEEDVTVVIPPNTLCYTQGASITPENHIPSRPDAMSKIYEFSPSGLTTQNRLMVVIPLFKSHSYDYNNLTLMYRKDQTSDFMRADCMTDDKPTWLFHGNMCYIFLNHFCGIYVTRAGLRQEPHEVILETLLFYKYGGKDLNLKLTFGCYNDESTCSRKHVIQHYTEEGYTITAKQSACVTERHLTVEPEYSEDVWKPAFHGKGTETINSVLLLNMCQLCDSKDVWPSDVNYKFSYKTNTHQSKDVAVRFGDGTQSRTLSLYVENQSLNIPETRMTWQQVKDHAEITEVFYLHTSQDDLASVTSPTLSDKREQIAFFLDTFIIGYYGSTDTVDVLSSLIIHTKQFASLDVAQSKLQWLKWQKNLKRKLYDLCKEDNMSDFPKHISDTIPQDQNCSNTENCPDDFTKIMHLMDLVLQKHIFYHAFKSYCKKKPALQAYIPEDISISDDMFGYNRHQYNLPKLCKDCLLIVAKSTMEDQHVILVLPELGREFCFCLNHNIITQAMNQNIKGAKNDLEALQYIREAFLSSRAPDMIDILLTVLNLKIIGKNLHADKIREVYHKKITQHQRCAKC